MDLPLRFLELNKTKMVGPIPSNIGNLSPTLQVLVLIGRGELPNLDGPIPTSICHLVNLKTFVLTNTHFVGSFSSSCMASFLYLEVLNFKFSPSIAGELSTKFWSHPMLKELNIGVTNFAFSLPDSLPDSTSTSNQRRSQVPSHLG